MLTIYVSLVGSNGIRRLTLYCIIEQLEVVEKLVTGTVSNITLTIIAFKMGLHVICGECY